MPTGAELFIDTLLELGVRHIFTLVGDHLNDVLQEAARRGVQLIDMRHESGVTHAAEAWARLTRRPAVALVTGGPGHTNALTGVAAAWLSLSPLIAVSGARSSKLAGKGAFQDVDHQGMARPIVKWSAEAAAPEEIPGLLRRAFHEANAGRRGPVHLNVPVDVFAAQAGTVPPAESIGFGEAAEVDTADALAMLRDAERPVVIAGSGVWWADAGALTQAFVEREGLPLYTVTFARGVVPDSHRLCFGYGDPALNRAALTAFREADAVLLLGKRLDYRLAFGGARLFASEVRFAQAEIHPAEIGLNRPIDHPLPGCVADTLRNLLAQPDGPRRDRRRWLDRLRTLREEWRQQLAATAEERREQSPMHPAAFYRELARHLPAETQFSWDGGDFVHWGRAMLPAEHSGGWVRLGPLGAIGSALPNAVAHQLLNPGTPIVMITGDGSLGFYLAELDSLLRHRLPVVIIVGNDGGWGLEKELQQETGPIVACDLAPSRYDLVMQGFGGGGETIESVAEVGPAVSRALRAGKPYLINALIRGARSPFTDWQVAGKKAVKKEPD